MITPNLTCLCFAFRKNKEGKSEVLLIHKERGPNEGMWVPPGGKVEWGETPLEAGKREFEEETGLSAKGVLPYGLVTQWEPPQHWALHLVGIPAFGGKLTSGKEGQVKWVGEKELYSMALPKLDDVLWPYWWNSFTGKPSELGYLDMYAAHKEDGSLRVVRINGVEVPCEVVPAPGK